MGFSLRVAPGLRIRASGLVRESVLVSGCGRPVFVSTLAGRAYLLVWGRFRSTIQLTEAVIGGAEPAWTYDLLAGLGSLWLSQALSIAPSTVSAKPVA